MCYLRILSCSVSAGRQSGGRCISTMVGARHLMFNATHSHEKGGEGDMNSTELYSLLIKIMMPPPALFDL